MPDDRGFVDRRRDLSFLEERWAASGPQVLAVTGRRRVGKTTLLKEFMQDKPHVYHLVNQEEDTLQLRRLRDAFVEAIGGVAPEVEDWHDLFAYLENETAQAIGETQPPGSCTMQSIETYDVSIKRRGSSTL